ncbi:MAG TPA: hypothetical protein VFA09_09895 [Ktedonobacteraceae bacterium]|nr:hypothetical protein [Ktedonobacteraceae bacterium]
MHNLKNNDEMDDDFNFKDEDSKNIHLWSHSGTGDFDGENEIDAAELDGDDDFDVKITDLPPDGKVDSLLANFRAWRGRPHPGRDQSGSYTPPESGESDDDFELEISDLPEGEKQPSFLVARPLTSLVTRFSPRERRRQALSLITAVFVAILVIMVMLEGMPSAWNGALSLLTGSTATPTTNSNATLTSGGPSAVSGSGRFIGSSPANKFTWHQGIYSSQVTPIQDPLEAAPQYCPGSTGSSSNAGPEPGAIGRPPLWISGLDKNGAALTQLKRSQRSSLGWYEPITLLLQSNYTNVVVLEGASNDNDAPVFLDSVPSGQGVTALLLLDPSDPTLSSHTIDNGSWIIINTNVYIPAAGCYSLTAEWAEGSWTVFFAAGR